MKFQISIFKFDIGKKFQIEVLWFCFLISD